MSWISGPCNDGNDEAFNVEPESNVVRASDDEGLKESSRHSEREQRSQPEYEIADQGTHFGKNWGHWAGRLKRRDGR